MRQLTTILVEPNVPLRVEVSNLLGSVPARVMASVQDLELAEAIVREHDCDLIVAGVSASFAEADLLKRLSQENQSPVVLYVPQRDADSVARAQASGARALLGQDELNPGLLQAVQSVARGESFFPEASLAGAPVFTWTRPHFWFNSTHRSDLNS